MDLTSKQRRHLRALAHHLDAVVMIGNAGLTDAVVKAVDVAITRHELVKVRVDADSPDDRHEVSQTLAQRLNASEVQVIGRVLVLYRRHATEPKLSLPDMPAPEKPAASDPKRLPMSRRRPPAPEGAAPRRGPPSGRRPATPARGRRSGS
ncbi:MAG: ribosome assembly RNA-binding protein YhbY [Polyangiales bacterium]